MYKVWVPIIYSYNRISSVQLYYSTYTYCNVCKSYDRLARALNPILYMRNLVFKFWGRGYYNYYIYPRDR